MVVLEQAAELHEVGAGVLLWPNAIRVLQRLDVGAAIADAGAVATNGALTYDAASDTYSFVWKTTKTWAGCRALQLNFADGSMAMALFNFSK